MKMNGVALSCIGVVMGIIFIITCMIGLPIYGVWQQGLKGEAALAKSKQTKMIQIEQATAEFESAKIRVKAVEIMGEAAKKYPEYRLQEFMAGFAEALQNGDIEKIIYVPTESNIPIMEATRNVNKYK